MAVGRQLAVDGTEVISADASYLFGVMLGLFRAISEMLNLPGLGAGELRVRDDEVSDLAGEGDALTGSSNLAGLAEFEGIVIGLSRGESLAVR